MADSAWTPYDAAVASTAMDDSEIKSEKFVVPNSREIRDWLVQTKGIPSNTLKKFMNSRIDSRDATPANENYHGKLSLAQQMYICQDIYDA